ncbi:MAG TPA: glycosyltransferase family 4 protein [Anaerolineales bacterium]|nr:glycosyltransferase family 4 protein [Anaerolineales bacterium]
MRIDILHYSVAPVVGGVEAVIQAHAQLLRQAGYPVTVIAGIGEQGNLPPGTEFTRIPEMDSRHPGVVEASRQLEAGVIPADFERITAGLHTSLNHALEDEAVLIIHNVFTKHFNLPLTAALVRLLEQGKIKRCIAWCHDFTWTSSHSRSKVHPGFPWDLLRTMREDVTYITVSRQRQAELAGLYQCPLDRIQVVYNGVDPVEVYGLTEEGLQLVDRLGFDSSDLILLMPVRITQAKNIEFALQVVSILKSSGIRPKLVVTGPPDPHDPADMHYYQSLLDLRRQLQVEEEARFVYESGPSLSEGYMIDTQVVMQLYRACDVLFMPSHREGFGMPIMEAGIIGKPIFTTPIPAAEEIGAAQVTQFSLDEVPEKVAGRILAWSNSNSTYMLMNRIRQNYTWKAIFQNNILPLLQSKEAA